jgi:regulator of nucleoside diphosphate kinase
MIDMREQKTTRKPAIVIGDADHQRLEGLASAAANRLADVAEELLSELDRAKVKPQTAVPDTVVQMGSTVTFRAGEDEEKSVTLVYPAEADIEAGRVSVLTPIGTALIGLSQGQSIAWHDRSGRVHQLTVVAVRRGVVPPGGKA